MKNTITLRGKIKDSKTIELESDLLNEWKYQEVVVSIKSSSSIQEMLDEMKIGKNIGYMRIKRDEIYRV